MTGNRLLKHSSQGVQIRATNRVLEFDIDMRGASHSCHCPKSKVEKISNPDIGVIDSFKCTGNVKAGLMNSL